MPAAFAGLSRSLPALAYADEMQERAAEPGLRLAGPRGRHRQGRRGGDRAARGRRPGAPGRGVRRPAVRARQPRPQAGYRPGGIAAGASRKFARRFAGVERLAGERHLELKALGLDALDELWQDVKREEAEARIGAGRTRKGTGMSIGGGVRFRGDGRTPTQLRPVSVELDVQKWTSASVIIRVGGTHVLCAATIEDRIPPHLRGKGTGWVTAEYSMLPGATSERSQRESCQGQDRRPDPRDPAAHRAIPAGRGEHGGAR